MGRRCALEHMVTYGTEALMNGPTLLHKLYESEKDKEHIMKINFKILLQFQFFF